MTPRLEIHFDRTERRLFRNADEYEMPQYEFWLNHCRSGIQLALQALGLKPQTGVGMMVYNCHTVMNAIRQAKCKPVFVDITDGMTIDMEDLARKRGRMKVLIVTHLFGIINDVKTIKKSYPDLVVIEDCAHCFEHNIDGDFGVYSVGQGKFPSIGDGGILQVKREWVNVIKDRYAKLPSYTRWQEWILYVRLWMKAVMYRPCLYGVTMRLKERGKDTEVYVKTSVRKMSKGIANILVHKRMSYMLAVEERKRNARQIDDSIIGENAFMAVVRCENPAELKRKFLKKGIETATHFKQSVKWAEAFGYKAGSCPNAERLVEKLLMIPTYIRI